MLNFGSNEPFYVNENLTKSNFEIFNAAIKLKKQKVINSAYTLRGVVYVKRRENDKPTSVNNIEELTTFFRDDNSAPEPI